MQPCFKPEIKPVAAVILAAGKGTRMRSKLPKVLHKVCGRPLLTYVLEAVKRAGAERIVVVAGFWRGAGCSGGQGVWGGSLSGTTIRYGPCFTSGGKGFWPGLPGIF